MSEHTAGDPHDLFRHRRPDFLVISPPKTGSTWLADNLRRHPQLFVPAIKEVKYFSSLYQWLDYGWYCDHFNSAGERRAGEASPSYASLPLADIRNIRRLLPDVKLVFLMREPVARAWSHAKHNRRYREANFADAPDTDTTDHDQWRANFVHDWPLVAGDYLGQLRRWASVFPAEQLHVGFYESIAARPDALLRDVFRFLGVDPAVDLTDYPVEERILVGPPGDLPAELAPGLHGLLRDRTNELIGFLRERFGLSVPDEWRTALDHPADRPTELPPAFRAGADDAYLTGVARLEDTFASSYRQVQSHYRGYDIAFYRGTVYAVAQTRGPVSLVRDDATRDQCLRDGTCLACSTLDDLKEQITTRLFQTAEARTRAAEDTLRATHDELRTARDELRATREVTARIAADLAAVHAFLRRPSLARRVLRVIRDSARPVRLSARQDRHAALP